MSRVVNVLRDQLNFWRTFGLREGIRRVWMTGEAAVGVLKGTDHLGNQYYENPHAISGRTRYVVFSNFHDYDPSQVPAEWHSWLHYLEDVTPVEKPPLNPIYKLQHQSQRLSQYGHFAQYQPPGALWRKEEQRDWTHENIKTWKNLHAETVATTQETTPQNPPKPAP